MGRQPYRQRSIKVYPDPSLNKEGWNTFLDMNQDWVRIEQEREVLGKDRVDIIALDPPTMDLLIKLWQELKQ